MHNNAQSIRHPEFRRTMRLRAASLSSLAMFQHRKARENPRHGPSTGGELHPVSHADCKLGKYSGTSRGRCTPTILNGASAQISSFVNGHHAEMPGREEEVRGCGGGRAEHEGPLGSNRGLRAIAGPIYGQGNKHDRMRWNGRVVQLHRKSLSQGTPQIWCRPGTNFCSTTVRLSECCASAIGRECRLWTCTELWSSIRAK